MKLALYLPRCLQRINLPFPEYKDKKPVSLLQMSRRLSMRMEVLAYVSANRRRLCGVWLGVCPASSWFAGEITGGNQWRPVYKEKASAFLSTQEPNYLAGGNNKQKLMSTTKIVKELEISSCLICPQLRRVHCLLARCAGVDVCQRAEVRCE